MTEKGCLNLLPYQIERGDIVTRTAEDVHEAHTEAVKERDHLNHLVREEVDKYLGDPTTVRYMKLNSYLIKYRDAVVELEHIEGV